VTARTAAAGAAALLALGCAGAADAPAARSANAMAPCPDTPNCVSSLAPASDPTHSIAPMRLKLAPEQAWAAVLRDLAGLPRTRIVDSSPEYVHAEVRSFLFRFVDDLELRLDFAQRRIDVRSASRVGYSDLGVNRARIEQLGARLRKAGAIE
jgi:uncharacterized protein (DUF1499 family)